MLKSRLRDYASTHGGRYLLFGSAARGTMWAGSDVDLIACFDRDTQQAAIRFAELQCADLNLPLDIRWVNYVSDELMADAERGGEWL